MKYPVLNLQAAKAGNVELDDSVFGIEHIRSDIVHRMVVWQLAKRRAGTHKTKTRSEIRARRGKTYRQKGTGNARHGARSAPIFVGGGVAHGPRLRSHAIGLQKKVRQLALRHALSAKVIDKTLIVLEDVTPETAKTGVVRKQLAGLGALNALIITGDQPDAGLVKATANIPDIDVLPLAGLNVYDIVRRRTLILTKDAVKGVHTRFGIEVEGAS